MTPLMNCEKLLEGFEPDFEFIPPKAIPETEFYSRIEKIRRAAVVAEHDVTLINANPAINYNTSNKFLRYACDWPREGILMIPTDSQKGLQLFSFWSQSVLLPPSFGEAIGVEKLYQVGALGREYSGRPYISEEKLIEGVAKALTELGYDKGSIGVMGDNSSKKHWSNLQTLLPKVKISDETHVILDMQHLRTKSEIDQIRASAQLMDIGFQAACHVCRPGVTDFELYAAFTFAQMARGGESGDGYQIGVNRYGTHCGKAYGHRITSGDLINFYISGISYRGYSAQSARMIAVGNITAKQEETLEVCTEALRRAEQAIKPGVPICHINKAGFIPFIDHGYIKDDITANMPYNWAPNDDMTAMEIPVQYVPDANFEETGRKLMHIYPPVAGPHNPNMGHGVGMPGDPKFNITSHNTDICAPGLCFVIHPQWLVPMESGANIGNCYVVTEDGYENLTCHTPIETVRIKA